MIDLTALPVAKRADRVQNSLPKAGKLSASKGIG